MERHDVPTGTRRGRYGTERRAEPGGNPATQAVLPLVLGTVSDVVLQVDRDGRVEWISPSVADVLAFEAHELVGIDMVDLVHPDDRERVLRRRSDVLSGGDVRELPVRLRSADGGWRQVRVRARPLRAGGDVVGALVTLRDDHDVTATRRALATVLAVNAVLVQATTQDQLLAEVCESIVSAGGYPFCWYGRALHDDRLSVLPLAVGGDDLGYTSSITVSWDAESPFGQGPTGVCIRTGTTQVRNDLAVDPNYGPWQEATSGRGIRCSIALPVLVDACVDGALMVYAADVDAFGPHAQEMLEGLAADLGLGLQRLVDTERRLTAEERFRLIAENSTDVVFLADPTLRWQWVSQSSRTVLGWDADDLVGSSGGDYLHPEDLIRVRQSIAADPHSVLTMRLRFRRPDGTYGWVSAAGRGVLGPEGEVIGRVVSMRDIGDEVDKEEALAASEARFRLLAENSVDVIYQTVGGVLTWVSPSVRGMFDMAAADFVGRRVDEIWGSDLPAVPPELLAAEASEHAVEVEFPIRDRAGVERWINVTAKPFRGDDGQGGSTGAVRDVTSRVEAVRSVERAERQFRLIAENALDVVLQTTTGDGITWVSPSVREVLGWEPEELTGVRPEDLVHPDDRPSALASWRGTREEPDVGTHVELRVRDRDGGWRWMRDTSRVVRAADGSAVGRIGTLHDIAAEVDTRTRLAYEAGHDALTGLRNRRGMLSVIDAALAGGAGPFALVAVGVDGLQSINDAFTHTAGDRVLLHVAERLLDLAGDHEAVARSGDNQFTVLVGKAETASLSDLAAGLVTGCGGTVHIGAQDIPVTVSVGVALADGRGGDLLVRDASTALHQARAGGGNRWEFLDPTVAATARQRLTVVSGLHEALSSSAVRPWFQPIVNLADAALVGYEALVRWVKPDGDVVTPDQFLTVAEQTGLIVELDRAVLAEALDQLSGLPSAPHIAVNVSAPTLASPGLVDAVREELARTGVTASRLQLEVTETSLLHVTDEVLVDMRTLARLGVTWWVDDFGTGYSSIAHLRDMPVGGLKLDRSFTAGVLDEDSTHRRLAHGLFGLAHGLGLRTVAEGVETGAQADALVAQGWELGQGWLFGRPSPDPVRDR